MTRSLAIAVLVCSLLAAGCVQAPDVQTAAVDDAAVGAMHKLVSFTRAGVVPTAADFAGLHVEIAPTGLSTGEPSLGVTSDGAIYVTHGDGAIARSTDHGATWEDLSMKDVIRAPKTSLDPWVWVDPVSDRVYNAPLYVACTWASWSDDGGDSWDFNPIAGCGIPAHDHQKLTSFGGEVVYYSYNSFRGEGTWVTASKDGGRTFPPGMSVHPDDKCHSGIASPVIAAPDGTAYSGHPTCDGVSVAVTKDSGSSWSKPVVITDVGAAQALAHMVDVATDEADHAYVTWTGADGAAYIVSTTDAGETWSAPKRVSPPTLGSTVYNVITAGADGKVVVGFLGTEDDATKWDTIDAQNAADTTVWNVYLSYVDMATSDDPVVTTIQVNPADDPVQIGCIWQSGGSNPCRNLGDFIDLVQRDGRPYLVYADGCDACSKNTESRGSEVTVAFVEVGPSLLGGALGALEEMAGHDHAQAGALLALPELR
ncbi:MAG TPA: sialidase family protein [Candidatus Thermoplasmatota archaeon]|nr:sialidase family protein [Candidatus Thermoplasmatota archaeon]